MGPALRVPPAHVPAPRRGEQRGLQPARRGHAGHRQRRQRDPDLALAPLDEGGEGAQGEHDGEGQGGRPPQPALLPAQEQGAQRGRQ